MKLENLRKYFPARDNKIGNRENIIDIVVSLARKLKWLTYALSTLFQ
jgi:hypothetical protein